MLGTVEPVCEKEETAWLGDAEIDSVMLLANGEERIV